MACGLFNCLFFEHSVLFWSPQAAAPIWVFCAKQKPDLPLVREDKPDFILVLRSGGAKKNGWKIEAAEKVSLDSDIHK